jgi:heme-degrading monooxygenase HmoA
MITRIWHGRTPRQRAEEYGAFLTMRMIPDYREADGNLDVTILRSDDADTTHFVTITRWESEEAIRNFTGHDDMSPRYYPEDREFLLELEPKVQHYTVVARAP